MGIFTSKSCRPDTSVAMENYTKELGEKYEALQVKLGDLTKDFLERSVFDNKFSHVEKTYKDYQKALQLLVDEDEKLKKEREALSSKYQSMEIEVQTQKDQLERLEDTFFAKIETYERALEQSQNKITRLEKEAVQADQMLRVFKLNKLSHANGIKKEPKEFSPRKTRKQSTKKFVITPDREVAAKKKKRVRKGACESPLLVDDGQENQGFNYLELITENYQPLEDKSSKLAEKVDFKDKRVFEEVDMNIQII